MRVRIGERVRVVKGKHAGTSGLVVDVLKGGWMRIRRDDGGIASVQGRASVEVVGNEEPPPPARKPLADRNAAEAEIEEQRKAALVREAKRAQHLREAARALRMEREKAERARQNERSEREEKAERKAASEWLEREKAERARKEEQYDRARREERARQEAERRAREAERRARETERRKREYRRAYSKPDWRRPFSHQDARRPPHEEQQKREWTTPQKKTVDDSRLVRARHYRALKLAPSATTPEIKQQYRALARKCHPDKHTNRMSVSIANEVMAKINEAFFTLRDTASRQKYKSDVLSGRVE
ncbi:hypothetical protein CTAYLR_004546 [Chrysophaeum taylorii]|uniref:J domain-containing protein n=1 Tax=Chrysophaeum taylorii TaxID=2483200 RepID=A0AAD7UQ71_9STRA|nr:hypothetical protein CTAYLR_004546 [Chrysophaeum taylorii]